MHEDQLAELLRQASAAAPQDDLTATAWHDGRRRALRQGWTVGSLGAVAGLAAVVGAWSLGGGSTDASPGPADSGGVDDMAVTSTPPGQEMVPYRVVFEVTAGEARPDGPVESWSDVEGVTAQPIEMMVETAEGVARASHDLSTLGLGGPFSFGPDGDMVTSNGCLTVRWSDVSIDADGLLQPSGLPFMEDDWDEACQPGFPNPEALMMSDSSVGTDGRPTTTPPRLGWEEGALVAEGTMMEGGILGVHESDSGSGPRYLSLVEVPPEELDSVEDLPSTTEAHPPAGTPETVDGTWFLLDLRGIQPEPVTGPALTFDGETWSVETCGVRHTAPGSVTDGTIVIEGSWTVETVEGVTSCPDLPWQDLHTWETFLEAGPSTLLMEDGRHRGLALEGALP